MNIGTLSGEAFGVIVLFGIVKRMEPVMAYATVSIVVGVLALPLICIITEPEIEVEPKKHPLLRKFSSMPSITLAEATYGMTTKQKL